MNIEGVEELEEKINNIFDVYEKKEKENEIRFYGYPKTSLREIYLLNQKLQKKGYKLKITEEYGEKVIIISYKKESSSLLNIILCVLTLVTTLFAGSLWYSANPISNPFSIIKGWPFAVSVMGVLGSHEFGHYIMSKYHGVNATLPYFIPFPSIIGTMGAVIKIKGVIPDRKALFDIGIAGPLLGLVATIIVTAIGLQLPGIQQPPTQPGQRYIELNFPLLYSIISQIVGSPQGNPNPVVVGGWVGMFITFLNLLPAGQLDGGHILSAISEKWAKIIAYIVPISMFSLGVYVELILNETGAIWFIWGIITLIISAAGNAKTLEDKNQYKYLDKKRIILALIVFILGILSFTPVPVSIEQF